MSTGKTYAEDLESDAFDPEDYVERLAWRLTGGGENPLDPEYLHRAFEDEISNLQIMSDQCQAKITRLQNQCREEEEEYYVNLERLHGENGTCFDKLKDLNERINAVAAKVVHLGDQLQSVNDPRTRAFEALQLMQHFNDFLDQRTPFIFGEPDRLLESAEVIHKLSLVSQELPSDKFADVQGRIAHKYDVIESLLIEEFTRMQMSGNKQKMKQIATILSQFKNYSACIDKFVAHCQMQAFRSVDLFGDTINLCNKVTPLVNEIFPNPQQVMAKLVLNIFHGKLNDALKERIPDPEKGINDLEAFLSDLYDLYSKTQKLINDLAPFNVSSDKEYLPSLCRSLFSKYLDKYLSIETKFLRDQCANSLQKYYDSKNHQKKSIQSGGYQDFKRDIQARFIPETFGGETFISEEVAINILQETKQAFQRCQLLSTQAQLAKNVQQILEILVQSLCQEHLDYALELALYGIPLGEPKTPPETHFFKVVRQTAAVCHLFEKQFDDSVLPLIKNTPNFEECLNQKRNALGGLEAKLSNGLDRLMNAIVGYIKYILSTEQKKTDFKPENDDTFTIHLCTNAASMVIKYLNQQLKLIRDSLDGGNLDMVMSEIGIRFHRTIVEHIYQFVYSSSGAALLLCDVNEYRKCVNTMKIPLVNKLFEILYHLCNLLFVASDSLAAACGRDDLAEVERAIITNFVQLRADYKTAKLYNDFR